MAKGVAGGDGGITFMIACISFLLPEKLNATSGRFWIPIY
jgi:hypothetical protein